LLNSQTRSHNEKNVVLEIPESEAVKFEAALDELLEELRKLDERKDQTWREIGVLGAETRAMIERIKAKLHVEEAV
jgi:hypothetical protein